jgi:iron complex transport system ATP-binding protein
VSGPILRTTALTVGYPRRQRTAGDTVILNDLSLSIGAGELVCLLGPNGAGKSTLLRTIGGMQRPLAGEVWLEDKNVHRVAPRELARILSVVLTERLSTSLLTVYEIVSIGRHPYTDWRGTLTERDHAAIRKAIETVHVEAFIARQLSELSDGERQRVMLARALAQEPRLLILDEITAFLDLPRRVEIMHLLRGLAHEHAYAILMSTHDLELAMRHADSVWLCAGGQLSVGAPEELVWNGTFERAFQDEGLAFDAERGTFAARRASAGMVRVVGTGVHAAWTGRALERLGYEVVQSALNGEPEVEVHVAGDSVSWTVRVGAAVHRLDTLGELFNHVRSARSDRPSLRA